MGSYKNLFSRSIIIGVSLVALLIFPQKAYSWGSKGNNKIGFNTHWAIIRKAYELLKVDPIFEKEKFPPFEDIEKLEGSTFGPDGDGLAEFSEHYYNPNFNYPDGMPNGPISAATKYSLLVSELQKGRYHAAADPAAWCAHFIADMHVPFHISGLSKNEAVALYEPHKNDKEPILLDEKYYISRLLAYKATFRNNFRYEIENFKDYLKSNSRLDWFDPWYYNGFDDKSGQINKYVTTVYVGSSSHVVWEGATHWLESFDGACGSPNYDLIGLPLGWQNPVIDLSKPKPDSNASDAICNMAKGAAKQTLDNVDKYMSDPLLAFNRSVQRVYTAWRASFTALQPAALIVREKDYYKVAVFVQNKALENVKDVKVKISFPGDEANGQIKDFGEVPGGGKATPKSVDFQIRPPPGKTKIKIEISGKYQETPDLQYAVTEEDLESAVEEKGFDYYEGSVDELLQAAQDYIVSRKQQDETVDIRSDKASSDPEEYGTKRSFDFKKKIKEGYFEDIYSVYLDIYSPKKGRYEPYAKLSQKQKDDIKKRMAEYKTFLHYTAGEETDRDNKKLKIIEDNISPSLFRDNFNKAYAANGPKKEQCQKTYQDLGVGLEEIEVPRKLGGSYYIFLTRNDAFSDCPGLIALELRAIASNVAIEILVVDRKNMLANTQYNGGKGVPTNPPDPKAILYVILKKLPFSGSVLPVAAPRQQTAQENIPEEKQPTEEQEQPIEQEQQEQPIEQEQQEQPPEQEQQQE